MKFAAACTVAFAASANAFAPTKVGNHATQLNAMKDDMARVGAAALAGVAIFGATLPAQAITKSELNQLSYLQVKGTGLANRCSEVIGEDTIVPKAPPHRDVHRAEGMGRRGGDRQGRQDGEEVCQLQGHDPSNLHPRGN